MFLNALTKDVDFDSSNLPYVVICPTCGKEYIDHEIIQNSFSVQVKKLKQLF